ncbi:MAG TPA: hypothetical protein VGQ70_05930 [Candidatus Udaeobacter sp.]|jgi:hypothetical protein|nr:hypothetical protein [Candidatus Udaeobacter sp.]
MLEGLKHFAVVGLGFALIGGWILTLIANTLLGTVLEALLHAPPTDYYLGSALLTVVSISLSQCASLAAIACFVSDSARHTSRPRRF